MVVRVAIAEDHAMVRSGFVSLLNEQPGVRVLYEASNGHELIETLRSCSELPDVCLVDVKMPKLNGYETTARVKKQWPNMKVIALTMCDSEVTVLRMLQNGAEGFVLKDSAFHELSKAILHVHQGGCYFSKKVYAGMATIMEKTDNKPAAYITEKEFHFLTLCCSDLTYREIATEMNVSIRTVEGYRDALFHKLDINSRLGLMYYGLNSGIEPYYRHGSN